MINIDTGYQYAVLLYFPTSDFVILLWLFSFTDDISTLCN